MLISVIFLIIKIHENRLLFIWEFFLKAITNFFYFLTSLYFFFICTAIAQTIPKIGDQVAQPGGKILGTGNLKLVKVAEGFEGPVNLNNAGDGTKRIFVVEREGRIKIINKDYSVNKKPFLDLTNLRSSPINPKGNDVQSEFIEQGLFSIAFHPKFKTNGHVYVHYSSLRHNGAGVIVRFTVDKQNPDYISKKQALKTEKIIMIVEQPSHNNNGGQISFGPDGFLYIGLGDGGWGTSKKASQEHSNRLGKILRINVDTNKKYKAPEDNPFYQNGGAPENEIWAKGLHNPYKFSFDNVNGGMFIADVGDNTWEEINYIPKNSLGGDNFGWPIMEGTNCHVPMGNKTTQKCEFTGKFPIAKYKHPKKSSKNKSAGAFACASVQGLGVANYAGMKGVYLFGDWCLGNIYGVGWDGNTWQLEELIKTDLHITAGGNDENGNVLALSAKFYFDDQNPDRPPYGTVWKIVKN